MEASNDAPCPAHQGIRTAGKNLEASFPTPLTSRCGLMTADLSEWPIRILSYFKFSYLSSLQYLRCTTLLIRAIISLTTLVTAAPEEFPFSAPQHWPQHFGKTIGKYSTGLFLEQPEDKSLWALSLMLYSLCLSVMYVIVIIWSSTLFNHASSL